MGVCSLPNVIRDVALSPCRLTSALLSTILDLDHDIEWYYSYVITSQGRLGTLTWFQ